MNFKYMCNNGTMQTREVENGHIYMFTGVNHKFNKAYFRFGLSLKKNYKYTALEIGDSFKFDEDGESQKVYGIFKEPYQFTVTYKVYNKDGLFHKFIRKYFKLISHKYRYTIIAVAKVRYDVDK